ncbi:MULTISPECIES: TetR/AcrR family transcriptional regulator [unclassified Aureispira]|uniref:TetR/AcrR family transcriptional regulator n=1 Tax=unclassified Aureispira TaxID=2649989 RepID=UPI000697E690|nr:MULTISPECIES: TetR/AcrR family transcriptional regulator [unclassified Aureispira]WMX14439.1 TetR/AcrR family transcriptional regulator [Aureispira sp. CCB-E]
MSRDLENKKCQAILKTAKELFWKHGVKRVSIQEICKEAKTSKMTFYKFFDNKIDLAKTILDLVFEEGIQEYKAIMEQNIPFAQKVKETLLAKARNSKNISQEFITDIYKNNDLGLLEYIYAKGEVMMDLVLDDYEQAQKEGYVRPGIKREFMRYQLLKMREMVLDDALLVHYDSPQELTMELTNFFFYGLLVHEDE